MALVFLTPAAALAAEVTPDDIYPGWVQVTCKLAYYAEFHYNVNTNGLTYDLRLDVADQHRTSSPGIEVQGVVMEVVTPKEHAGQTICIWLDPPAVLAGGVHFKPGLVYAGKWRSELIGTLTFKGEVPFVPLAEPSGPANGSQPIRSDTNRTSSAAGSRR